MKCSTSITKIDMKYCYKYYADPEKPVRDGWYIELCPEKMGKEEYTAEFDNETDFINSLLQCINDCWIISEVYIIPDEKQEVAKDRIDMSKCPVEEYLDMYYPDGTLIVHTNSYLTYNYVRAEIKEKQLKGCYIMFKGQKIRLDRNGTEEYFPDGMMDKVTEQLFRLV